MRIVSLLPSATEMVYALGLGDALVGIRLAALGHLPQQLEEGGLTLEQSLALYEEGMHLAQRCQALLSNVEQRIETLRQGASGAQ